MWATALKDGVQVGRGFATLAATTARRHHLRHSTLPPSELQIVAIVVMAAGAMGLADDLAEFVLDNGGTRVLGESVLPKIFDVGEGSHVGEDLGGIFSATGPDRASSAFRRISHAFDLAVGLAVRTCLPAHASAYP